MKKSIIAAGAASVALAAMPIVGAMAVDFTDVIQTTVNDTCTFARKEISTGTATGTQIGHSAGSWTRSGTTPNIIDTLTAQTITIATDTVLGASDFHVVCNDPDGYTVTIGTNPLVLTTGTNTHTWAYNKSDPTSGGATPGSSYWWVTSDATSKDLSNDIVSSKASADDGSGFTVTYHAYAVAEQDAGTYSATVTYTFAQLP